MSEDNGVILDYAISLDVSGIGGGGGGDECGCVGGFFSYVLIVVEVWRITGRNCNNIYSADYTLYLK